VKRAVAIFTNETHEAEAYEKAPGVELGRMHITRRFTGDLEGESTAELLTATTPEGSAVYLGLDRITGRLDDREGSFVLQHGGEIDANGPTTWGKILAASAAGALAGLRGTSEISVDEDGTHRLTLEYELADEET
jgi:hypothetical protein